MHKWPHELATVPAASLMLAEGYMIYRNEREAYQMANAQSKRDSSALTSDQIAVIQRWEGVE